MASVGVGVGVGVGVTAIRQAQSCPNFPFQRTANFLPLPLVTRSYSLMSTWHLECSACDHTAAGLSLATVCPECGQPYLVRFDSAWPDRSRINARWDMWRYSAVLPLLDSEEPVSLGEGATPMMAAPNIAKAMGVRSVWIKDEGLNPTASFKARGMSAAVTRARAMGVAG